MTGPTRPSSLTQRQGFGIALIGIGLIQLFSCVISEVVIIFLIITGHINYYGIPTLIGVVMGLGFSSTIGIGILLFGIYLLRDQKGMYVKFLKN